MLGFDAGNRENAPMALIFEFGLVHNNFHRTKDAII